MKDARYVGLVAAAVAVLTVASILDGTARYSSRIEIFPNPRPAGNINSTDGRVAANRHLNAAVTATAKAVPASSASSIASAILAMRKRPLPAGVKRVKYNFKVPFRHDTVADDRSVDKTLFGWPPSRDRNIPNYVKPSGDNYLLRPAAAAPKAAAMLIAVQSAAGNFKAREGIRQTWGSSENLGSETAVVFVVGTTPGKEAEVHAGLAKENAGHGDILQVDIVDHYNNLSLKVASTLKYFNGLGGEQLKYLFKTDDDSYLNLPVLWSLLREMGQSFGDYVLGHALTTGKTHLKPISDKTSKWWCPRYMFSGERFPMTLSGAGYLLTAGAARCVYKEVLKLPFFHLEDVFVTGFGTQNCDGVDLFHSAAFKNMGTTVGRVRPGDILLHYVDTAAKKAIHAKLAKTKA